MPTKSGKQRWQAEQRNHVNSLFRAYHDDDTQGLSYFYEQLRPDDIRAIYDAHPVFALTEWRYFGSHIRDLAGRATL